MKAKTWKVWVCSDLQLASPERARAILSNAVDDLLELNLGLDAAWCLGDAACGASIEALEQVASINLEEFRRLGVPVGYVMGNHEMDAKRALNLNRYPLYEQASLDPLWNCGECDAFYFTQTFGKTLVVFMGDHFASDGSWWSTRGKVMGEGYPHPSENFGRLREFIKQHDGPVIMASHYALPGGQRPSERMGALLPLPENVRLHLHGHAHIGDSVFNPERTWDRVNPIDGELRVQYNISALENVRSPGSHSAILEFGDGGPVSLSIRCHSVREWVDRFELGA